MSESTHGRVPLPSVSLHQLRLFVTLARHRSFTRAGDEFGITQSAVSRSIRELEDEIALRLFDRTTRQVALTDTGRRLLARIAPLVEELEATLRPPDAAEPGVVNLASSCGLTASVLPSMLASCRERLPQTSVVVIDRPQSAVLQLVRSGEADLGVVISPGDLDELIAEPLFDDGLAAVVSASHRLSGAECIDWTQLRGQPLLLLDDDTGSLAAIEAALAKHAVTGAVRQRFAQSATVISMAQAGLGIGLLPMHAHVSSPVRFIPLNPDAPRTIMLVRRRGRALRASAANIWSHLSARSSHTFLTTQAIEA